MIEKRARMSRFMRTSEPFSSTKRTVGCFEIRNFSCFIEKYPVHILKTLRFLSLRYSTGFRRPHVMLLKV